MPELSVPNPWMGLGEKVSGNRIGGFLLSRPLPPPALGALCLVWLRGVLAQWLSISCTSVAKLTSRIIPDKCALWGIARRAKLGIGSVVDGLWWLLVVFFFLNCVCACTSHIIVRAMPEVDCMRGFLPELMHAHAEVVAFWKMQRWLFCRACKKMLWVLV